MFSALLAVIWFLLKSYYVSQTACFSVSTHISALFHFLQQHWFFLHGCNDMRWKKTFFKNATEWKVTKSLQIKTCRVKKTIGTVRNRLCPEETVSLWFSKKPWQIVTRYAHVTPHNLGFPNFADFSPVTPALRPQKTDQNQNRQHPFQSCAFEARYACVTPWNTYEK